LQVKGGVQWIPIPELRLGFSLSTPSYLVMLAERLTANELDVPPGSSPADPMGTNTKVRKISGGWFGSEPGTMRLGIAYAGKWGWIEGDVVVDLGGLRSSGFLFNHRTVPNGKIGAVINVHKFIKLGLGAFTDLSQTEQLLLVGDRQVDFFGGNFGVLFTNKDTKSHPPEKSDDDDKLLIALAIGVRYSHGRGNLLGLPNPPRRHQSQRRRHQLRRQSLLLGDRAGQTKPQAPSKKGSDPFIPDAFGLVCPAPPPPRYRLRLTLQKRGLTPFVKMARKLPHQSAPRV
jgi:hypothetical protein